MEGGKVFSVDIDGELVGEMGKIRGFHGEL